ncbi:MAG: hypothetical protein ACW97A_13920 [Candidatus Thorarchaeota archaeon]|jgi:hypothetical protein
MDLLFAIVLTIGVLLAAVFNYILNLAPGSDPEDFQVGPSQLGITCDCYLNTLILGGIVVLALSLSSAAFTSRIELYIVGIVAFILVTAAGIYGRRKRYKEWKEMDYVLKRAVSSSYPRMSGRLDIPYDEDEEPDKMN